MFCSSTPRSEHVARSDPSVPIDNYRKVMISYTEQQAKVSSPPTDWLPYLDDQIRTLKALIKSRPAAARLEVALNTNRVGVEQSANAIFADV